MLLEDIRDRFDLVLEGHASLHKQIDEVEDNLNNKISLVDYKVEVLNQKIDDVDKRLTAKIDDVERRLTEKIDHVAADLAAHRADTESHRPVYKVKE